MLLIRPRTSICNNVRRVGSSFPRRQCCRTGSLPGPARDIARSFVARLQKRLDLGGRDSGTRYPRLRCSSSGPGHLSVIMFGVLVVVFRGDNVAAPDLFLGQREISLVASLRACKNVWIWGGEIRELGTRAYDAPHPAPDIYL